jgi:hypothetical protein
MDVQEERMEESEGGNKKIYLRSETENFVL